MSLLCRYVDPGDLTTVLLDLNSTGGSFSGNGFAMMGDPAFGSRKRNVGLLKQPGVSGSALAFTDDDLATITFQLGIPPQANYDAISALVKSLAAQVGAGGVIAYQPDGASHVSYLDALPASSPALLNAQQDAYYQVVGQLLATRGLDLTIPIQPFGRWAPLSADVNVLGNSGLLEDFNNNGIPDLWVLDSSTGLSNIGIDWSQQAFTLTAATATARNLQQTDSGAVAGDIWTLAFDGWCNNTAKGRILAQIEYRDAGHAVLATYTGTVTVPGTSSLFPARAFVTTGAAPASTAEIRASLQVVDVDATAVQHWWTRAQLEKAGAPSIYRTGAESCSNDLESTVPFANHLFLWNPTNGPSKVQLSVHPENGAKVIATRIARRSQGNLAEYSRKIGFLAKNAGTLGVDASVVADPLAASGNALQWSFATSTGMSQVFRNVLTPTDLTSFRGVFAIRVAVRPEVLTDKTLAQNIFQMQLRWQKSDPGSGAATSTYPVTVQLDTTWPTVSDYVMVDLGYVSIDSNVAALDVEIWASRVSGTGKLFFGKVLFAPADELTTEPQVPGFLTPGQAPESFPFTTWNLTPDGCKTGAFSNGSYITTNRQYWGFSLAPAGGVVYTAGRHVMSIPNVGLAGLSVQNGDKVARTIGYLRVRKSNTNPAKRLAWTNGVAKGVGDITWDSSQKGRTFICTGAGTTGGSIPAAFATATDGQTGIADGSVTWAETTVQSIPLTAVAGQLYSLYGYPSQPTIAFDYSGSTPFEVVFVQTALGVADGASAVRAILAAGPVVHTFVRTVGDATTEFVSDNNPDPLLREAFLRSNGAYVDRLYAGGPFVELAPGPGWSVFVVEALDVADPGYDSVGPIPLAKDVPSRGFTVKASSLVPLVTPPGS